MRVSTTLCSFQVSRYSWIEKDHGRRGAEEDPPVEYNHKIFHKKPPGKTSFFVAEEKSTEGQNIKTPTAAPCGLNPYPVLATRSLGYHCFHTIVLTPTVVHHPAVRAQGVHISLLVVDSLGLTVKAFFIQA